MTLPCPLIAPCVEKCPILEYCFLWRDENKHKNVCQFVLKLFIWILSWSKHRGFNNVNNECMLRCMARSYKWAFIGQGLCVQPLHLENSGKEPHRRKNCLYHEQIVRVKGSIAAACKFKIIPHCNRNLLQLASGKHITLWWVSGHSGILR